MIEISELSMLMHDAEKEEIAGFCQSFHRMFLAGANPSLSGPPGAVGYGWRSDY